jgi:hypothetical protein
MINLEADSQFLTDVIRLSGAENFREALTIACDRYLEDVLSLFKRMGCDKALGRKTRIVDIATHQKLIKASETIGLSQKKLAHCCLVLLADRG